MSKVGQETILGSKLIEISFSFDKVPFKCIKMDRPIPCKNNGVIFRRTGGDSILHTGLKP